MSSHIRRSAKEPIRVGLSHAELWQGPDKALICCWEVGRQLRDKDTELAARAAEGELVSLPWKGGTENFEELQDGKKPSRRYGGLRYLAMWQGLRGDDLDIALKVETILICARTKRSVTFHEITAANCDS
ncbi:MAG: hypothetical protein HY288_11090 [Planctomycetia bacterium]|nr:hypothetical protein [Planctomycetia bacterium]